MNKSELIKAIADATETSQASVNELINALTDVITKAVANDNDVVLTGFGKFYRASRKATTGRNPQTGAEIQIPAAKLPKFKAGKKFKDEVK